MSLNASQLGLTPAATGSDQMMRAPLREAPHRADLDPLAVAGNQAPTKRSGAAPGKRTA
ncbi:hypothetical protein GGTG_11041 [Gaeumannomyces tritici R3-111a-1]|uniref:Uncharacterized protein n=1 Tax=Gaeumannomyces tritici (strain R3-111a-1) TaxID=644352 RepID=J3PC17_GAET3|nr:hypothetical protein GGTG_11041 [Gaeumannomyces tritici R3-111a-1]EJT71787.1 hypothetical protein GGTG_11041 [Gaeumannomyces tritici R3-111a-1]